jgi:hypothetical protein
MRYRSVGCPLSISRDAGLFEPARLVGVVSGFQLKAELLARETAS